MFVKIRRTKESLANAVMYFGSRDEDIRVTNYIGEVALQSCGIYALKFDEEVSGVSRADFLDELIPMQFEQKVPALDSFRLSDADEEEICEFLF